VRNENPRWTAKLAAAAIASSVLGWTGGSAAFERQWHAGADVGMGHISLGDGSTGLAGGAHLAYGLSDAFNAMFEFDVSRHPDIGRTVYSTALGAAYTLDITRWVPYAGVLVGGYRLAGAPGRDSLGVQLAAGMDYQIGRSWATGVQFRYHQILTGETAAYTTTLFRFEYLWGF
jgi:hypothetical protein